MCFGIARTHARVRFEYRSSTRRISTSSNTAIPTVQLLCNLRVCAANPHLVDRCTETLLRIRSVCLPLCVMGIFSASGKNTELAQWAGMRLP
jgi:hypothetical protein